MYFHARGKHNQKSVPVDSGMFLNTQSSRKSPVIQFSAASTQMWPLNPSPLTWKLCPFGAAISWLYKAGSGTERDWGQKMFGAESLTTSTMTTTVSRSSPAFWRGQPQKIWEPYCQLHTAEGQKSRALTGLLAEANSQPHSQITKKLPGALWFF